MLVKAANWLTHLEYDWESPVWQHWIGSSGALPLRALRRARLRDERLERAATALERWVDDLETVIDAAERQSPFDAARHLAGRAVCIAYAVRHPERVARLILYGGYARGACGAATQEGQREYEAIIELARRWGSDNPAFRQVFTSRFIPGGTDEQLRGSTICAARPPPADRGGAARRARPHRRHGLLARSRRRPWSSTRATTRCARWRRGGCSRAGIPGAQFVELDSRNHILLEHEPAWERFQEAVLDFTGRGERAAAKIAAFAALSAREREMLALIADGLSNAEIAERLAISGKTVRNHVSNVFDKLGVWSRAQAIVFARDRGFRR